MKQSAVIKDALRQWYTLPRKQAGSCQQFLKRLAEELAKEGK
ncbi:MULTISPECIES: hypothetical protein [Shewanella]|jgi:hypothetical protein|uniref:Uncharacterized protein n=3 Tax=Shewanella TaxID=22 RepID=A9KZC3_SHEB9|nr:MULTISPECIES: hypothetical protein [Shewanella]ABS09399.1 conserved hypothetical protein [Shewanella baltica OS185]ABX50571.1 conserved hypothetical protein [Shewanella baltica OS195]ADT95560.1 hypothetical protein Sbal678_3421 [Shewanella baltica OS678]MDT3281857.1 hypothetical protein [Shewanella sp. SP2S1-2]MDT3294390.1 hypothetical protein [Shewanella sp. SP2S2-6]